MLRSWCLLASLSLALAAHCAPAYAQDTQADAERRTVVVSVITSKGQLVNGLEPGNFRAELDGRPVQILSATYDTSPHRVVLLLDWSGSMSDKRILETTIAGNLLARINLASPVAVRTFFSKNLDQSPLSTDRAAAHAKLDGLANPTSADAAPHGLTPLVDALENTRAFLDPALPGDVVCLISDGGDNASKKDEWKERKILGASGIRIFTILLLDRSSPAMRGRTVEEAEGPEFLSWLSESSGGRLAVCYLDELAWLSPQLAKKYPDRAKEQGETLVARLEFMAREINFCYRLEIQLPEKVEKPRKFKLEVVDLASGKVDRNLTVHYPKRLYPIAGTQ